MVGRCNCIRKDSAKLNNDFTEVATALMDMYFCNSHLFLVETETILPSCSRPSTCQMF